MSKLTIEDLKAKVKELANKSGMEGEIALKEAKGGGETSYKVCEFVPKLGRTPESVGRFVAEVRAFIQEQYENLPGNPDEWGFSVQFKVEENSDD